MKNMKFVITFGIALVYAMLFTACDDIPDTQDAQAIQNGYGIISINFSEEETPRTVFPTSVFDKYEYTFTKADATAGVVMEPDNSGRFLLEVGDYTVAVKAYVGGEEAYILAASGESATFTVSNGVNSTVSVFLSSADYETKGLFNYTVTYPSGANAEITMQKLSDMSVVELNPGDATSGNGKTQTLELEADDYLFTIYVSNYVNKPDSYAGLSETVRIAPFLTTKYTKNFINTDMIVAGIPIPDDYNISVDSETLAVSVVRKANASPGEITIYYEGAGSTVYEKCTDAPTELGTYNVTFDVAAAPRFTSAVGLYATALTISFPTPSVGDYIISGTGVYTYDGATKPVTITRRDDASPGAITVFYNNSTTLPLVGGTYTVTFSVAAATGWNATSSTLNAGTVTINKNAGAAVTVSSVSSSVTGNSITVTANVSTSPNSGQTVEYAVSTSTTAPANGWQDSATFSGLNGATTYNIFARSKGNTNYNTGAAITLTSATTLNNYSVSANGSSTSRTTSLTFTFTANPGDITISNITLGGDASKGSATLTGSGTTRTLSPINISGPVIGTATVSISFTGIETGSKSVTLFNSYSGGSGLYKTTQGNYAYVDLSASSGSNIIDKAFNYINSDPTTYTLILGEDVTVAGHSTADVTNVSATRHLKTTNAKLTIISVDSERKITVTQGAGYGIFAVGRSGYTGIELTIGNNITLVGDQYSDYVVQVQNGAMFTLKDNASMSGNYSSWSSGRKGVSISNSTFIMQDTAKVTGKGGVDVSGSGNIITMSGYASVTDGISVQSGSSGNTINISGNASVTDGITVRDNCSITISDNALINGGVSYVYSGSTFTLQNYASVIGGVSGSSSTFVMSNNASVIRGGVDIDTNSTFTMKDSASISGNNNGNGVSISSNSKFYMQNNARIFNNNGNGVRVLYSGEFIMSGNSSIFGNSRGVRVEYGGGSFTMQDNATIYNNSIGEDGGGVSVYGSSSFTMKNSASISGNTANNGGGVHVTGYRSYSTNYYAGFIMQDNAYISGNTTTATGTSSGGGGVYVGEYTTFEMKGGLIWGNKADGASSNGGGINVYNSGTFNMSGGNIYGTDESSVALRNTAKSSGAALYVNATGSAKFTSNNSDITSPGSGRDPTITVSSATISVTATYNINGGTGTTPTSQSVTAGSNITLPGGSLFSRTGYVFAGWSTDPYDSDPTNNNSGTSYSLLGNITLYAKWVYTLTADKWVDGNIAKPGGTQWFRFTANAATQYIYGAGGSLTDYYIQLFDSSYNTVGGETEFWSWTWSASRTLTSGQVYYIRVTPYSSRNGTYKIVFSASSTAPAQ